MIILNVQSVSQHSLLSRRSKMATYVLILSLRVSCNTAVCNKAYPLRCISPVKKSIPSFATFPEIISLVHGLRGGSFAERTGPSSAPVSNHAPSPNPTSQQFRSRADGGDRMEVDATAPPPPRAPPGFCNCSTCELVKQVLQDL